MSVGHNSGDVLNKDAQVNLKKLVANIEDLEIEKASVSEAIKEGYAAAKGQGFDTKVLRKIVALKKKDRAKLAEENAIFDLYAHALGLDLV